MKNVFIDLPIWIAFFQGELKPITREKVTDAIGAHNVGYSAGILSHLVEAVRNKDDVGSILEIFSPLNFYSIEYQDMMRATHLKQKLLALHQKIPFAKLQNFVLCQKHEAWLFTNDKSFLAINKVCKNAIRIIPL